MLETTLPTRSENRLIHGIKSWTLAMMTSHTLSFIHLLVGMALAIVLVQFFGRRRAA